MSALTARFTRGTLSASSFLRDVVERIRTEQRTRRDIARLNMMSDYELQDIGLTRAEIRHATRNGRL